MRSGRVIILSSYARPKDGKIEGGMLRDLLNQQKLEHAPWV